MKDRDAEKKIEEEVFIDAISSIFEEYKTYIYMSALITLIMLRINAQPENFSAVKKRLIKFVKDNSYGENSMLIKGKKAELILRVV